MKIIIDKNIPYIKGVLEPWASVEYVEGNRINNNTLSGADALIIRTRTRCGRDLLKGTDIKFIGSATIGTDHIDLGWCSERGIKCVSAPGCNSGSVMQYLASALVYLIMQYGIRPASRTIGIVGVGNVGSGVARMAEILGFNVILNDPPREKQEGNLGFSSLKSLLNNSDIVSIHVPLTFKGPDRTYQLVNENFITQMKDQCILINTSRGLVADERAIMQGLAKRTIRAVVLDVWRNEPDIDSRLLEAAAIGTAHIAGYSADGKTNGVKMVIRQLSEYFSLPLKEWEYEKLPEPPDPLIDISKFTGTDLEIICRTIYHTYSIENDSRMLKENPTMFEKLRNEYPPRREFHAFQIKGNNDLIIDKLKSLGFKYPNT
ncbi:MAG TPA: 4-phosphoerythronate dehydrogenase [Bacteroidetes bacterium]|nr:4-phosphoerythronate dehydrogenase [Bacteroidota bacterium]